MSIRALLPAACVALPALACLATRDVQVAELHEIELAGFDPSAALRQETPVWCWAACAEMILRHKGIATSQEEIAARVHGVEDGGRLKVEMACRYEILRALEPELARTPFENVWAAILRQLDAQPRIGDVDPDLDSGEALDLALDRLAPRKSVPIDELLQGEPAVVGLRDADAESGHAYVLYGARYEPPSLSAKTAEAGLKWLCEAGGELGEYVPALGRHSSLDGYHVHEVLLIDPADGSTLELPYAEFAARVDFVLTRADARQVLQSLENVVQLEEER